MQQRRRRVPIQLQEAVQAEVDRLLKEGHIERVKEIPDKQFIQPAVITVKKEKSVKTGLDARALNNEIVKDIYQMPNLEHLVDWVAEQLDSKVESKALYTSLDKRYTSLQCIGKLFCCLSWNPGHENSAACPWNACLWNPGLMTLFANFTRLKVWSWNPRYWKHKLRFEQIKLAYAL